MGYTHGRKWQDGDVEKEIMMVVNHLGIDRFPTKKEIEDFFGNKSLSNKISKSGGSRHYASLLGFELSNSESEFGNYYEEYAIDDIFRNTGFTSVHMDMRYPYDLLTNGNIKVDIKSSRIIERRNSSFPYYSFNLEKREPTCDLFIFYCLNAECAIERTVIIPSCIISGKTQIGMGGLSKWEVYEDKWDYFEQYNNFYLDVLKTRKEIGKRRSKRRLSNNEHNS